MNRDEELELLHHTHLCVVVCVNGVFSVIMGDVVCVHYMLLRVYMMGCDCICMRVIVCVTASV